MLYHVLNAHDMLIKISKNIRHGKETKLIVIDTLPEEKRQNILVIEDSIRCE